MSAWCPADPAEDLRHGVGDELAAGEPGAGAAADDSAQGGDDRVEVGAGHGPEQQG